MIDTFLNLTDGPGKNAIFNGEEQWPEFHAFLKEIAELASEINSVFAKYDIDFEPYEEVEQVLNIVGEGPISEEDREKVRIWLRKTEEVEKLITKELQGNSARFPLWSSIRTDIADGLSGRWHGIFWEGDEQQQWRPIAEVYRIIPKPKPIVAAIAGEFQVFVSYKRRRNAAEAKEMARYLKVLGYSVWFDEQVLALQDKEIVNKNELARFIIDAVKGCQVVVVFEAMKEAIAFSPEEADDTHEIWEGEVMDDNGTPIAWNWQKLEIDNARRLIVVTSDYRVYGPDLLASSWQNSNDAAKAVGTAVSQIIGSRP